MWNAEFDRLCFVTALAVSAVTVTGLAAQSIAVEQTIVDLPEQTIQVGTFDSLEEAEGIRSELQSAGLTDVSLIQEGDQTRVSFGSFEHPTDALPYMALVDDLDAGLNPSLGSLASDQSASRILNTAPPSPFEDAVPLEHTALLYAPRSEPQLSLTEARARYDAVTGAIEETPADAAQPLLDLADANLREGRYAEASHLALAVATGRIPADEHSRLQARWRVAECWAAQGRHREAFRAYAELESQCSEDMAWESQLRRLELMNNLAGSHRVGSFPEVRNTAIQIARSVPDNLVGRERFLARADVVYLESFSCQTDYQSAVEIGEEIVVRYQSLGARCPSDVIGHCMNRVGQAEQMQGNHRAALDWFNRVIAETPPDAQFPEGNSVHAKAMIGLSGCAAELEMGPVAVMTILRDIVRMYPDDPSARVVLRYYPQLGEEVQ